MASPVFIPVILSVLLAMQPAFVRSIGDQQDFPCEINGTMVDCSYRMLESVPTGIPQTTTVLLLNHNRLNNKQMKEDSFNGLVNLETLDLSYNSISKVDPNMFVDQANLRNLSVRNNQINKLATDAFIHFTNLKTLDMSYQNNGMHTTSWFALKSLTKLEELQLEKVKLTSVNFGETVTISSLKALNMASNDISTISDGDFQALKGVNLDLLDLSNNPLTNIDSNIFSSVGSIMTLDVSSAITPNVLPTLSRALSNMDINKLVLQNIGLSEIKSTFFDEMGNFSLQELDFSFNNLTKLDGSCFGHTLRNVRQLDFYMNHIGHIDATVFTNLTSLRVLDLSNNSLTEVTSTMFNSLNGSNLEQLYIHKNSIQAISTEGPFRGLGHLKYLKLSKNKIKHNFIGTEFEGLNSLEVLDLGLNSGVTLSPNAFSTLTTLLKLYINVAHLKNAHVTPSPFSKLKSLVTLDLSNNSLPTISDSSFDDLTSLETLYLQHNNLYLSWDPSKGEPKLFLRTLSNLKSLDLSWNGFKMIPEKAFFNQTHLSELRIGRNKISHISDAVFVNTKRLSYLELQNNQITVVNKTTLNPVLPSLTTISIGYNPFSCSCALLWFRQWIDKTGVQIQDLNHAKCASPPDMADDPITDYHPDPRKCDNKLPLWALITIGVGSLTVIVLSTLLFIFRYHLVFGYYYIKARRRNYELLDGDNDEFHFDAFVSFSHKDEDWVRDHLQPEMEQKEIPPFRLCLHYRDFVPGEEVVDNITVGMERSRRQLCVVSQNYLESNW